jgi:hypothetical protein
MGYGVRWNPCVFPVITGIVIYDFMSPIAGDSALLGELYGRIGL